MLISERQLMWLMNVCVLCVTSGLALALMSWNIKVVNECDVLLIPLNDRYWQRKRLIMCSLSLMCIQKVKVWTHPLIEPNNINTCHQLCVSRLSCFNIWRWNQVCVFLRLNKHWRRYHVIHTGLNCPVLVSGCEHNTQGWYWSQFNELHESIFHSLISADRKHRCVCVCKDRKEA